MTLHINDYPKIGNKVLIVLSGLNRETKTEEGEWVYDKHQYHIADRFLQFKWSKSLIKQLLIYASSCDSKGRIKMLNEQAMAETMNVSLRTVQHNNYLMTEAGIIEWNRLFTDVIYLEFTQYHYDILGLETEGHSDKADRSTGFTRLTQENILSLMQEEDVNAIRTTLRLFALAESQFNGESQSTEVHVYLRDVTNFLPAYVGYKKKIKEILSKVTKYLPLHVIEGKEAVINFLERKPFNKGVLSKAKDALIYVLKKNTRATAKYQLQEDTYSFMDSFELFIERRTEQNLIAKREFKLMRDDATSLIASFGKVRLLKALDKVRDALNRYKIPKFRGTKDQVDLLYEEGYDRLRIFLQDPSKGLRYYATIE